MIIQCHDMWFEETQHQQVNSLFNIIWVVKLYEALVLHFSSIDVCNVTEGSLGHVSGCDWMSLIHSQFNLLLF